MGRLYDIIQQHIDAQVYPPSVRQVALQLGVSPTTVANWRDSIKQVPKKEHLVAIVRVTGRPWAEVRDAALYDAGLLIERPVGKDADSASDVG